MKETIIVGMSGGVDSAVSAALLVEKGYNVEAVFMKNWDEEDIEFCTAAEDYKDALQVCEELGIPLRSIDLTEEYWEKVFKVFLEECESGRTPNPDVLCNKEIKFKAFLDNAKEMGAEKIATGHYATIDYKDGLYQLKRGKDSNKDQSYFLYRLDQYQISKSIFPIGKLNKDYVRKQADKLDFLNFDKKFTSLIVLSLPKLILNVERLISSSSPIALRTFEGFILPVLHAEPFETFKSSQSYRTR